MAGRPAVNMINTLAHIYDEIIRASQMLKSRTANQDQVPSIVDWCANRMVAIDETYVAALRQSMPNAEFSPIDTLYQQATERLVKKANRYRNATITVHDRAQEATDLYLIAKMYQRAMNMLSTAFYKKSVIQAAKAVGVKVDQPATVINVTRYLRDLNAKIAQGSTYKFGGVANTLQKEVDRMRGEVRGIGGAADYIDRTIRLLREVDGIMADKRIPIEVRESQAKGVLRRVVRRYALTMQYIQSALDNPI